LLVFEASTRMLLFETSPRHRILPGQVRSVNPTRIIPAGQVKRISRNSDTDCCGAIGFTIRPLPISKPARAS